MLTLRRLEVEGFGPFADIQTLEFSAEPGVTVVYGENMRGKTSLLNAIRYAFFGTVVGRGSRVRRIHTVSNRDLAAEGKYGFNVTLTFDYDGDTYELFRECRPKVPTPTSDEDYESDIMLCKGGTVLGPGPRERTLAQAFPAEISRFFLFDGELLQEYEELLVNESEDGHRISEAIERILGVPILKNGRAHLTALSDEADKQAANEARKQDRTLQWGNMLKQATEQKEAHQKEVLRLQSDLAVLGAEKGEVERYLQGVQRYASLLEERDKAGRDLDAAQKGERACREDIQQSMADGWRTLVREPARAAREAAQEEAQRDLGRLVMEVRRRAVDAGRCEACEQDLTRDLRDRLASTLPEQSAVGGLSRAMRRLADLAKFKEADVSGAVRVLWKRLRELQLEQATLSDRISDLNAELSDADPDTVRRSKATYVELIEKIAAVKKAIDEEGKKIDQRDDSIQRLRRQLDAAGTTELRAWQHRGRVLRATAEVFGAAVERYKAGLRQRVEASASELFLAMTTEKRDYAGLTINEGYGLTIMHRDGRAEIARAAGAEHVVALALMGALQKHAPLRGPIVMDSPFGRLDENHTSNVVRALPQMAPQIILLVYEAEVGRNTMRKLLRGQLRREYELEYVSARRTNVRQVQE